jgi:hypothetical protein
MTGEERPVSGNVNFAMQFGYLEEREVFIIQKSTMQVQKWLQRQI